MVDLIAIALLICVLGLIIRGMVRGSIKTCDTASCGGDCGACHGGCATHGVKLSRSQKKALKALDQRNRVA